MARSFSLESAAGSVALGGLSPFRLLRGASGFGLPPVQNQWFQGAGRGASLRGVRVLPRPQSLPFKIMGADRIEVWQNFEMLSQIFAPEAGEVTMRAMLDGEEWSNTFTREGGGDYSWDTDTDGKSFIKTVMTVKSGDPFFTRTDATSQRISLGGLGRGLLKGATSLSELQLSTNNSLGEVQLFNPGSVGVGGLWVVEGPFTGFTFTSPSGEVLDWDVAGDLYAAPTAADTITIDFEEGTAIDNLGRNRFGGFTGTPKFWQIPPGTNTAGIELENATSDSAVTVFFNPKRWVLF